MHKRLQIDVSLDSFERLKKLKELTDSSSYGDVTQKALKVLEYFMREAAKGNTAQTIDKEGNKTIIEIL